MTLRCRLPASSSSPGCRSWRRRRHVRKLVSHNLLHRHLVSSPSRIVLASVVRRPVRFGACPLMNLCGNGTATRPESGHRSLSFPTPDSGRRSGVTDRGVDPEFCDYGLDGWIGMKPECYHLCSPLVRLPPQFHQQFNSHIII